MRCSHLVLTMSPAHRDLIQCETTPAHHIMSSRTPRNDVEAKNKGCYKNRPTLWNGGVVGSVVRRIEVFWMSLRLFFSSRFFSVFAYYISAVFLLAHLCIFLCLGVHG